MYERDILAWSEDQAARLGRLAASERANEAGIDWANVIEEVESVGRSEFQAVESLLVEALRHMAKLAAWPEAPATAHWTTEALAFLLGARRRISPSMRRRLDVPGLYADAARLVRRQAVAEGRAMAPIVDACPLTLDELLAADADPAVLAGRLRAG
nr:DUF29 domain-containing protein [Roseomonas acroporae]